MTKETAQQLKALGFPQIAEGGESKTAYAADGTLMAWKPATKEQPGTWPKDIDAYVPSSREIVRAFGSDLTPEVLAEAWVRLQESRGDSEETLEDLISQ
jgi:hypothetical protein